MVPALAEAFHAAHQREFGVSTSEFPVAVVSIGVSAIGKLPSAPPFEPRAETTGSQAPTTREVFFDGSWVETTVLKSEEVRSGQVVPGPAIVEYPDSCAILPPGSRAEMDAHGNLLITLAA